MTTKGSARRQHILTVARRVLAEEGVDGFVLRGVAEHAGMALGNLQYYFPTRVALLEAVVRHELEGDLRAIDDAVAGNLAAGHRAVLSEIVRALLRRWFGESQRIYLSAGAIALHDDDLAAAVDEVWGAFYDAIASAIRAIDPTADGREIRFRAVTITALLDGASLQRPAAAGLDPDEFVERVRGQVLGIAGDVQRAGSGCQAQPVGEVE